MRTVGVSLPWSPENSTFKSPVMGRACDPRLADVRQQQLICGTLWSDSPIVHGLDVGTNTTVYVPVYLAPGQKGFKIKYRAFTRDHTRAVDGSLATASVLEIQLLKTGKTVQGQYTSRLGVPSHPTETTTYSLNSFEILPAWAVIQNEGAGSSTQSAALLCPASLSPRWALFAIECTNVLVWYICTEPIWDQTTPIDSFIP